MRNEGFMTITSVLGPVEAEDLGHVQMHEHLLSDISGYLSEEERSKGRQITLANYYSSRVDRENPYDYVLDDPSIAVSELRRYREYGGGAVVDVTPEGVGRDPEALQSIADESGVPVVMGCGFYAQPWHPSWVQDARPAAIAKHIVRDLTVGAQGTDIRAGIIGEIGLSWPPHPDEIKVLTAAGYASQETGAAISIHPGRDSAAPLQHLDVVSDLGVPLDRVVMCHIDRTLFTIESMRELASTGCTLEFDLFGTESSYYLQDPRIDLPNDGARVAYLAGLVAAGYSGQLLISEDVCRKTQLVAFGGEGYSHILERVIPLMNARGLQDVVEEITRTTPARLLTWGN